MRKGDFLPKNPYITIGEGKNEVRKQKETIR